jgi:hypothetical protein
MSGKMGLEEISGDLLEADLWPASCFPQGYIGTTLNQTEFCFGATIARMNGFR